ncbi:TPA: CPBP family intramembrane metalloprotease [Streptococcus suis]|nr:CPBP family intramembrane metalloprotease [Streptococcus suis]
MKLEQDYFSIKENTILISILFLLLLELIGISDSSLSMTWVSHILIISNIRRLRGSNDIIYFFRITGYFAHLGLFSLLLKRISWELNPEKIVVGLLLSLIVLVVYFYFRKREFKIIFSKEYISQISPRKSKSRYFILIYNYLGAAISEELYFRMLFLELIDGHPIVFILVSTTYFMLFHYTLLWSSRFTKSDFINQTIMGIALSVIYVISDSIFFPILIHIIINFPNIYLLFRLYCRDFLSPKGFSCEVIDDFKDLEI